MDEWPSASVSELGDNMHRRHYRHGHGLPPAQGLFGAGFQGAWRLLPTNSESRLRRAVLKVIVLVVVLFTVPPVLWWLVGNPLPEPIPGLTARELAVRQPKFSGQVVVNLVSMLLWVLWAQLVWSVLWELLLSGPRRACGTRTGGAPLVNRWMNEIVDQAISGLYAASVVVGSADLASVVATRTGARPTSTEFASSKQFVASLEPAECDRWAVALEPKSKSILVQPGDSLWSLAEGDVTISRQILKMNSSLDSALDVVAGLDVLVPTSAASDSAEWFAHAVHSLAARTCLRRESAAVPVAASLQAEQLVVTMNEADSTCAPRPWTTSDGGRTWRLPRSWPAEDLPLPPNKNPFPAFVAIGHQLMVNLESIGVLSVVGEQAQSVDLVRSMFAELATSPVGHLEQVFASSSLAHLCQAGSATIDAGATLVGKAKMAARSASQQMTPAQAGTVHHYRLNGGRVIDPVIVFCLSSDLVEVEPLLEQAGDPGTPLLVVVLGELAQADYLLRCQRGTVEIEPRGLSVKANAKASVKASVKRTGERKPTTVPLTELDHWSEVSKGAGSATQDNVKPLLTIGLLGPIEATGIEGSLTPQQLSLVSFLACVGSATRPEISEALWDGRAMSPGRFPNLLTEVRRRIGRHHLPEAVGGRYRLAQVQVDLHEFERLCPWRDPDIDRAERSHLVEALKLVRGVPLTAPAGRYWSWVGDYAYRSAHLESQVVDTALRLADAARSAGDKDTVRWAAQQGLLAAPLDESLIEVLAAGYVDLGKPMAAKRLVDNWETSVDRLS